jgi:hypothetical protein
MSDLYKEFWENFPIPFQEEDPEFEFINSVVVQQQLGRAPHVAAQLGEKAEILTREIANAEVKRDRLDRALYKFRRKILAQHYSGSPRSGNSTVLDAYIRKVAEETGMLEELEGLETGIEECQREIESRKPVLNEVTARLKLLRDKMDWCREYLNMDKLMARISTNGR